MKPLKHAGFVGVLVTLALLLGMTCTVASARPAPRWRLAYYSSLPNSGLESVVAAGRRSAWALGSTRFAGTLLVHWNGVRWRAVRPPGGRPFRANVLAASGPSEVWLFGFNRTQTQAEAFRFDGIRWHSVPIPPNAIAGDAVVLGPSDVWVESQISCSPGPGSRQDCTSDLWHWNGHLWTDRPVNKYVTALAAVAGHMWLAAATAVNFAPAIPTGTPSVFRLNGSQWQRVALFSQIRVDVPFETLSATSGHDVWLVAKPARRSARHSGVFHFDGRTWSQLRVPLSDAAQLYPAMADGHGGIWLGPWMHWTGRRFAASIPPGLAGVDCFNVDGLARMPGSGDIWGAGWAHKLGARDNFNAMVADFGQPLTNRAGATAARPQAVCVASAGGSTMGQ